MSSVPPVPSLQPAKSVFVDKSSVPASSSASVWDRISKWVSENKALVYTIAGVAVVVTSAGVVYYLSDTGKPAQAPAPSGAKKKSKKERRLEKKRAEEERKAREEQAAAAGKFAMAAVMSEKKKNLTATAHHSVRVQESRGTGGVARGG